MKVLSLLLGLLIFFQCSYCPIAFAAVGGDATADGGPKSETKVNKVGALLLTDGLCVIAGSTIAITSASQTQLAGHTFKVTQLPDGGQKGYAWFNQGPGLSGLGDCPERVDLMDGTTAPGPIQDVTSELVTAAGKTFPMSSVKFVHSGRVFKFQTGKGAAKTSFDQTCTKIQGAKKPPKESHLTRNIIIGVVVAAIIATAIAVPVAVATHNNHHHSNPPEQTTSVTQPPPPPPPPSPFFPPRPPRRPPPPPPRPPTNT